jgi:hypothetical protein
MQTTFVTMKYQGHSYRFYSNHYFFDGAFEYGDGGTCKHLRWMKILLQSTWDHEMLYVDRSSTSIKTVFVKNQKYECGGQLKVKIHILFYGDNS